MEYIKQTFVDQTAETQGTVLKAKHFNTIENGISQAADEINLLTTNLSNLSTKVDNMELSSGIGDLSEVTSAIGYTEATLVEVYGTGKFTGSGYYNENVIINGFTTPFLKSKLPDTIDEVNFYIKAKNIGEQQLTAFIGYTPSITSPAGMVKFKEVSQVLNLTQEYKKYSFPLTIAKADLSSVPDDGMIIVGFYPPDGTTVIGCGCCPSNDEWATETKEHKAFYYYGQKWSLNSGKQYWYASFSQMTPPKLMTAVTKEKTGYREGEDGTFYLDNLRFGSGSGDIATTKFDIIKIPDKYDLVVNDTFELFWNGILLCKDYTKYNIEAKSSIKGHIYRHKFEVTPTTAGTYSLTINVYDDAGNLVDSKITQLIVKPALTEGPAAPLNIVCMGASDTNDKAWPDEFARRLCGTTAKTNYSSINSGNGPKGLGLGNINFIGTKTTPGGYGYEGTGGWTWDSYMNLNQSGDWYITLSTPHTKQLEDQESVYRDSNGKEWQLETLISETRLMMKPFGDTTASDVMPASGTLTYVSGGEDFTDLIYSSCERGSTNPFAYGGEMSFKKYCERVGADKIDYVFSLLVFNGAPSKVTQDRMDAHKNKIKRFYNYLTADYPDAKLVVMDSYLPCFDGCGVNYDSSSHYGNNFRTLQEWAFAQIEINRQLKEEYDGKIDYVSLAGVFDSEHNFPTQSVKYNSRNDNAKFSRQNNGLHPTTHGSFQSADALFRYMNNELQD